MDTAGHIPVLLAEVLAALEPRPGEVFADATAGLGGHARAVAERLGPSGVVVLNDADPANLARAAANIADLGAEAPRVASLRGNFADLPRRMAESGLSADMLLADLGFASTQVDDPARGFSFRADGPLDMRMDPESPVTAAELVNTLPERELSDLIREFGEERNARAIASKLVSARAREPIVSTARLAEIVRSVFGGRGHTGIDPATRTFQALRMAVNDEVGSLDSLLRSVGQAAEAISRGRASWLRAGARVAVIGFHSLEDRPVKRAFADLCARGLATPGRGPVRASEGEVAGNARARSAKLRWIRLGGYAGRQSQGSES